MLTEHGNVQPRPLSSVPASGLPAGVTVEATRLTEALLASAPRASTTSATKILDLVGDVAPRGNGSPRGREAAILRARSLLLAARAQSTASESELMAHGMTEDEFADLQKSYNIVEAALAEEEVKLTTS